jgi:putative tricarboxylic transport membrane protein
MRSTLIGTAVGTTPGIGSTVASFLGYAAARKYSDKPEEFGTGKLEGIAATEAANSSVVGANLIPLLALGIPGNVSAALLVGAFVIHGITPGPLLFEQHPRLIYGLFGAMILANISNFIIGNIGLRFFVLLLRTPTTIIYPTIVLLCLTGGYMGGGGIFAVAATIVFAVFGYLLRKFEYSFITFVIGFVLGPMFELTLRQTLVIFDGKLSRMFDHPVAVIFLLVSAVVVFLIARNRDRTGGPSAGGQSPI